MVPLNVYEQLRCSSKIYLGQYDLNNTSNHGAFTMTSYLRPLISNTDILFGPADVCIWSVNMIVALSNMDVGVH